MVAFVAPYEGWQHSSSCNSKLDCQLSILRPNAARVLVAKRDRYLQVSA